MDPVISCTSRHDRFGQSRNRQRSRAPDGENRRPRAAESPGRSIPRAQRRPGGPDSSPDRFDRGLAEAPRSCCQDLVRTQSTIDTTTRSRHHWTVVDTGGTAHNPGKRSSFESSPYCAERSGRDTPRGIPILASSHPDLKVRGVLLADPRGQQPGRRGTLRRRAHPAGDRGGQRVLRPDCNRYGLRRRDPCRGRSDACGTASGAGKRVFGGAFPRRPVADRQNYVTGPCAGRGTARFKLATGLLGKPPSAQQGRTPADR